MGHCSSVIWDPKLTVCGVGPDCRERAPWNGADADHKLFARAFEAFAMMHAAPLPNAPTSRHLKTWVEAVVENQCKLMSPQPSDEAKSLLQAGVVSQCEALSHGSRYRINGAERRVALSADWKVLTIDDGQLLPLAYLISIQLDTTWQSFDAIFVFVLQNSETSTYTISFDQVGIRIRFALSIKVLRLVGKKRRSRVSKDMALEGIGIFKRQVTPDTPPSKARSSGDSPQSKGRSSGNPTLEASGGRTSSKGSRPTSPSNVCPDSQTSDERTPSKGFRAATGFPQDEDDHDSDGTADASCSGAMPTNQGLDLCVGAQVFIHGLQDAAALNGDCGVCQYRDIRNQRWHVKLKTGEMKSIRKENLAVIDTSSQFDSIPCVICLDARAEMAFIPCGHQCVCRACAESHATAPLDRCPQCRQVSTNLVRIFR